MAFTASQELSATARKFVRDWGDLADRWGVERSVAETHALLWIAAGPLGTEQVADVLQLDPGTTQEAIDALVTLGVARPAVARGNSLRYEALPDVWEMFRAILEERRRREVEPAMAALRDALLRADNDDECDKQTRHRLAEMQGFLRDASGLYRQLSSMPTRETRQLLRIGGKIRRALGL